MKFKDLPNYITYSRIVITFALLVLLSDPTHINRIIAFSLILLAAFSDFLDGFLARKYSLVSNHGKLLDPLTDKILVISVLIMFVELKRKEFGVITDQSYLPAWLVALFVIREIWVLGLRSIHALKDKALEASQTAKWKTTLQMLSISLLVLGNFPVGTISGYVVSFYTVGFYLLLLSLIFGIISAVAYTVEVFKEN
ncbi:MAG: CDP-diacylglycerol--glycerol-3-phosphate 3-phosphatidyltransferase [Deltaproteobacteria bacterium]|nr:CDP-diacylglycerol--glycerol-3-phosphate 3-phosphatidyltransferase [Deltaproteobacteria bacterium]